MGNRKLKLLMNEADPNKTETSISAKSTRSLKNF